MGVPRRARRVPRGATRRREKARREGSRGARTRLGGNPAVALVRRRDARARRVAARAAARLRRQGGDEPVRRRERGVFFATGYPYRSFAARVPPPDGDGAVNRRSDSTNANRVADWSVHITPTRYIKRGKRFVVLKRTTRAIYTYTSPASTFGSRPNAFVTAREKKKARKARRRFASSSSFAAHHASRPPAAARRHAAAKTGSRSFVVSAVVASERAFS